MDVYGWGYGHPGAQRQILVLARVEIDNHGNPLHHLDVIAGGVFRGQQAETCPAGARETADMATVSAAVGVHSQGHALAHLHVLELGFLEVGHYPDVAQIDDRQQQLSGFDVLAGFDRFARHDSRTGRLDSGVFKVQLGLLYLGAGISGAIQHRVGMQTAEHVVAINKDPDAPIGEFADLFVVGDLFQIVPALTEEIRRRKGS